MTIIELLMHGLYIDCYLI